MRRLALPTVILGLCTACAAATGSGGTPAPNNNPVVLVDEYGRTYRSSQSGTEASFEAPLDSVWNAVMAAYSALEMEATTVDKPGGTIARNRLVARRMFNGTRLSKFFNCGDDMVSGPNADNGEVTASVVSRLLPTGDGTTVSTMVTANIRLYTGASGNPIRCGSTGELEERLRKAIATQLGRSVD